MLIYISLGLLQDPVDELFDDASTVDSLLLQPLLVVEHDLVLFTQIAVHAGVIGIQELMVTPHSDDEIFVYFLLQE